MDNLLKNYCDVNTVNTKSVRVRVVILIIEFIKPGFRSVLSVFVAVGTGARPTASFTLGCSCGCLHEGNPILLHTQHVAGHGKD